MEEGGGGTAEKGSDEKVDAVKAKQLVGAHDEVLKDVAGPHVARNAVECMKVLLLLCPPPPPAAAAAAAVAEVVMEAGAS